jgi:hypothetical protein
MGALESLTNHDLLTALQPDVLKDRLLTAQSIFESLAEEERDKWDNMNEGLQGSPTGQALEQAADALDAACGWIDEAISCIALRETEPEIWYQDLADHVQQAIDEAESF